MSLLCSSLPFLFFFFNDTATTEIYTLSLHDALPISITTGQIVTAVNAALNSGDRTQITNLATKLDNANNGDRKSTRLNSSHGYISYAVFCLKKKKPYKSRSLADSAKAATATTYQARN